MQNDHLNFQQFLKASRLAFSGAMRERPVALVVLLFSVAASVIFWSQLSALAPIGQIFWLVMTCAVVAVIVAAVIHAWALDFLTRYTRQIGVELPDANKESAFGLVKAVLGQVRQERQVNDLMLRRVQSEQFRLDAMELCLNGFTFEIQKEGHEEVVLRQISKQINRFFRSPLATIESNWQVLLDEIEPRYHAAVAQVIRLEQVFPSQQSIVFKTRRAIDSAACFLQLTVMQHPDVANGAAFAVCRDVTDLVAAREKAEQADSAKSEFLATISHELRTPLNAIVGFSRLLSEQVTDETLRADIQSIITSGEGLHVILNDIIDYSRIQADGLRLEVKSFDVAEMLGELHKINSSVALKKGLEFTFLNEMTETSCVSGDSNRLRQVVQNLVSNALKFTDSGFVQLRLSNSPAAHHQLELFVEVSDSGIGISDTHMRTIFDRFSQGSRSIHRQFGGSGLGLAISKGLVEKMGGRIDVSSEPGVGSVFTVRLVMPMSSCVDKPAAARSAVKTESLHVLVVDDHPMNRKLLDRFLSKRGHTVVQAEGGEQSVELANSERFDLILMDIDMPDMDGHEATRAIRAGDGKSQASFICALSGLSDEYNRQLSTQSGMNRHLTKPVSFDEVDEIASMLSARRQMSATKSTLQT
ncbi:hypothetical protein GCM10007875_15220 [Limnobacter litoralis]|uniref:histidine kinase n=2 Tax=Limnobacter litoralis TaxID=481366 RepID=A0ABQ5YVE0_9BURK|nr:hypothetical protein GCM10007875_15220 [Limnobacter litoralis]